MKLFVKLCSVLLFVLLLNPVANAAHHSSNSQFAPRWPSLSQQQYHHQKGRAVHRRRQHRVYHATVYPGSLQKNVRRIAAQFGWYRVIWNLPTDYHWVGTATISGNDFKGIFEKFLQGYPVQAQFYKGNHVLIVIPRQLTRHRLPAVIVTPRYYVDTDPINLKKEPTWLRRFVSITAYKMPLSMLMNRLLHKTNINATYDSTVKPNCLVSLDYSGSVRGALQSIAAETNYRYTIKRNSVRWSAFETKTFNVSFISGRSRSLVWRDLRNILSQMKSPQGRVIVSRSTRTITVRDHPSNVDTMTAYLESLPNILRKRG